MWLIADSGSTKTEWLLYDSDKKVSQVISTCGLNPYFVDDAQIESVFWNIQLTLKKPVKKIWFYGAGCSADVNKQKMHVSFKKIFNTLSIQIETDMMGAAHALSGSHAGIICILGTGANSCLYNGESIIQQGYGLGYVLGDEGSGAYLGKQVIKAYLQNEMPLELKEKFENLFGLLRDEIIESVYRKPFANRYLASFTPFLSTTIDNDFSKKIVIEAFDSFFKTNVLIYSNYKTLPIHFVGSVAFYFANIIKQVAAFNGLTIGKINKSIVADLLQFHLQESR